MSSERKVNATFNSVNFEILSKKAAIFCQKEIDNAPDLPYLVSERDEMYYKLHVLLELTF